MVEILTNFQKKVLKEIGKSELSSFFVWSGGTLLSYKYLFHRKSFDLDFFSQELFSGDFLLTHIKKIAQNLKIKKIKEYKKLNRHEFWLEGKKDILKIEFVFFPFAFIKKPNKIKELGVKGDSLEDILTNKIHAVFERSEPKDVFDIYCIFQKRKFKFLTVLNWIKKKFGVEIDPVFLTAKILEGTEKLDLIKPLILKKEFFQPQKIKKFFEKKVFGYLKKKMK